jgi:hypothetical protein
MVRTRWYLRKWLEPKGGATTNTVEATITASFFILTVIRPFLFRARENALGLYDSIRPTPSGWRVQAKGE